MSADIDIDCVRAVMKGREAVPLKELEECGVNENNAPLLWDIGLYVDKNKMVRRVW
ncbi:MAG: hypothetical protein ACP5MH_10285 [Thermoproteus sp.]